MSVAVNTRGDGISRTVRDINDLGTNTDSSHPSEVLSHLHWHGVSHDTGYCGYCKGSNPGNRPSVGMVATNLTVYLYQELLDKGWRRSGTYVYLPLLENSCCPAYTIRLNALKFQLSSRQRRNLRIFQEFLSGEWARKQRQKLQEKSSTAQQASCQVQPEPTSAHNTSQTAMTKRYSTPKASDSNAIKRESQQSLEETAKAMTEHCNTTVAQALQHSGPPEVSCVAQETGGAMIRQKQPDQPTSSSTDQPNIIHMQSSICWKAASKAVSEQASLPCQQAAPNTSQQGSTQAETHTTSKKKSKKAQRKALKQTTTATHGSQTISTMATELADSIISTISAALACDPVLSTMQPDVTSNRGHLQISLVVPQQSGEDLTATQLFHNITQPTQLCTPQTSSHSQATGACEGMVREPQTTTRTAGPEAMEEPPIATSPCRSLARSSSASEHSISSECSRDSMWCEEDAAGSQHETSGCSSPHATKQQWWLEDPPEGGWQFRTVMQESQFDEEEYQLYVKYQQAIHNDSPSKVTRRQFTRFLIDNPFGGVVSQERDPSAPECGYGAFHIQWWIGTRLVAICVVDVLPRCLSSKYFIWDPDLPFLSLGQVSALKEIEWVQNACSTSVFPSTLQYSYLGLYIHSNQKMRYKANFRTSELLCPATLQWVEASATLLSKLDQNDGTAYLSSLVPPLSELDPDIPPWSLETTDGIGLRTGRDGAEGDAAELEKNVARIQVKIGDCVLPIERWKLLLKPGIGDRLVEIGSEFVQYVSKRVAERSVILL